MPLVVTFTPRNWPVTAVAETEIVLVESIQSQFIAFCIRAHEGKLGQGAGAGSLESRKIEVATGTGHDERNLRASHKAGIAFVEMSVPGEDQVGQNSGLLAGAVDLGQHCGARGMVLAAGKRGMMHRDDQCPPVSRGSLLRRGFQLLLQKS